MGKLGIGEILLILIAALLIFGPKKLPEIGQSLGKSIQEFKKSMTDTSGDSKDSNVTKSDEKE